MAQLRFGGLESQGNIVLAVSTTGSDTPSANRPARITRGDYSAFPFLTIQAAIDALAPVIRYGGATTANALINIGVGNFAGFMVEGMLASAGLQIAGTRITSTLATGSPTGTATGGTTRTLVDAGATWTPDDLVGRYVNIASGPGAGQIKLIAANTATALTVADVSTSFGAGSVYTIEDSGTVITSASPKALALFPGIPYGVHLLRNLGNMFLRDLKIAAGTYRYYGNNNVRVFMIRVLARGAATVGLYEQSSFSVSWRDVGAVGPSFGIALYNIFNQADLSTRGLLAQCASVGVDFQNCAGGGAIFGVYSRGTGTGLRVLACPSGMKFFNTIIDGASTGIGCQAATIGLRDTEIKNCTVGCFSLFMSQLYIESSLVGTGNAGWGLYAHEVANAIKISFTPTITGAAGEVTVDGVTDVTWAALASSGTYALNLATGSRISRF